MGALSIWDWLTVLLGLGMLAIAIVAVATERSDATIGRLAFLKWVTIFWFVPVVVDILLDVAVRKGVGNFVALLLVVPLLWPFYRAAVRRARDIGWGKRVPALAIVPPFSVIAIIVLLTVPGKSNAAGSAAAVAEESSK